MDNDECSALNKDIPSKEMEELEDKNAISWEMHSHYKKKKVLQHILISTLGLHKSGPICMSDKDGRRALGTYLSLVNCLPLIESRKGRFIAFHCEPTNNATRLQ